MAAEDDGARPGIAAPAAGTATRAAGTAIPDAVPTGTATLAARAGTTSGSGIATEQRVLDLVTGAEVRDLAVELVRAVGENPPGGEGPMAQVLAAACRDRGLEVVLTEVAPDRPNVVARTPGGTGPSLLLLAHTDVVPVGEGWSVPPFAGQVVDGRLVGRGAADTKGNLAAAVVAMAALVRAGVRLTGPVELAAVVDEEETGLGVQAYLADHAAPLAGCVVAEPTDLRTVAAARGDSYVRIHVTGRAAHAGSPADGVNAVAGAARVVTALGRWHGELAAAAHPLVGPATVNVGEIHGGTGTSTVPADCVVAVDRRLLPGESGADALRELAARLDALDLAGAGMGVRAEVVMEMPGFETPVDAPLVRTAAAAVRDAGGPDLPVTGWSAACDGGYVARATGTDVVVLGAGSVTGQAHRPDESVALADLLTAARAYALCALRTLG
ncbi:ArgE/DapE family deacylase [Georgenia subflava]|uniref:Probable succinyl-diaminopimelate desuccinylase n=2 Tax=Georgenia subflava TaxID=1622177 RepID=A0A6N7EPL4_9MICO|nr:ArgE/DapE family deacylase [Georgenia subflava]